MDGQYVAYTFYRVDPAWRRLPVEERQAGKDAFAEVVEDFADRFEHLRAYTTTGVRPDGLLPLEDHGALRGARRARRRAERHAARRLARNAVLVSRDDEGVAVHERAQPRKITPRNSPYLVVYPFVKTRPWYALPSSSGQSAMDEHIRIGREEFPGIKNHTTYSFGIDDQEFMTAFECDEPADFMHLMLRLREASAYTERDTPIFVGQHVTIREALAALDGASARVQL